MLRFTRPIYVLGATLALVAAGCTSEAAAPSPSTVDPAAPTSPTGIVTVKVGAIVNTSAPTAERDERLAQVLIAASKTAASGAAVEIDVIRINDVGDVGSAVSSLAGRGVTVIAALCDDATVPATVDAAVDNGMLAITACVTLPTPTLSSTSPMFIDLAGLGDAPAAIAAWSSELGAERVATIGSDLVDDVDATCANVESSLIDFDISLEASVTFTELVDQPETIVATASSLLAEADVIVLCALPPTAGDFVDALRLVGFDQPVVVPWFADDQSWSQTTSGVYVIAPASRHRDDPKGQVTTLLDDLGLDARAVDVVAADSIAMLSEAADQIGSVGSRRLAEGMRRDTTKVLSGTLALVEGGSQTTGRAYRAIEVTRGEEAFEAIVTAAG